MVEIIPLLHEYLTWLGSEVMQDTTLNWEADRRVTALEGTVVTLEQRIVALESATGVTYDADTTANTEAETWETPPEEEGGSEGTTNRRRGRRQSEETEGGES